MPPASGGGRGGGGGGFGGAVSAPIDYNLYNRAGGFQVRARQSTVLVAHQLGIKPVQGDTQIVIYEEGLGEPGQP
jgi:hypothetical protein